jgi:hypothetical protein
MSRARRGPPFGRPEVARVFKDYPESMRRSLMRLRRLIFDTAARLDGVGPLEETLRWGEPAYVTTSGSGSTIRIDRRRKRPNQYDFRAAFPDTFTFEGNRAIVFDAGDRVPVRHLAVCISAALTYHREPPRGRSRRRRA